MLKIGYLVTGGKAQQLDTIVGFSGETLSALEIFADQAAYAIDAPQWMHDGSSSDYGDTDDIENWYERG